MSRGAQPANVGVGVQRELEQRGFVTLRLARPADDEGLHSECFHSAVAGTRCLLDSPRVVAVARELRRALIDLGVLPAGAVAIQAIAFDKTVETNWKVTWHQDLMFPFARRASAPDYAMPSVKDGVDFARPPGAVLESLLAVRLHLDRCDETNGPLRVAPGSHRLGIISNTQIAAEVARAGETICLADEGDALLMRPLLLHASSRATEPRHRRVLHFVFHSGESVEEPWHRAIG